MNTSDARIYALEKEVAELRQRLSEYEPPTEIPYSERELIQQAINNARPEPGERDLPRWILVKRLFGTGQTVSELICTKYGFDPDREISAPYQPEEDA